MSIFDNMSGDETVGDEFDAEKNLNYWIQSHGLPEHFPLLGEYQTPSPYLRNSGNEIEQISLHVTGSMRSAIIFPDGQGATTTLGELVKRKRGSSDNQYIFVVLDLISPELDNIVSQWRYLVSKSILTSLAIDGWGERLQGLLRKSLLGLLNRNSIEDLKHFSRKILEGDSIAQEFLNEISAFHSTSGPTEGLAKLIRDVSVDIGLDTIICFDISSRCSQEKADLLIRELKEFSEEEKPDDFSPTCLREAYFIANCLYETIGPWKSNFQEKWIDSYTNLEIFSILEQHFRPRRSWRTPASRYDTIRTPNDGLLSEVLDDKYISEIWNGDQSFIGFSELLKEKILQDFSKVDRTNIDFVLRPRER